MKYPDVLALPLVTFWSFNRQVDRLRAENEQRQLRVAIAGSSESAEAVKQLSEALQREIGTTTVIERGFDEKKFAELQEKFSKMGVASNTQTE